MKRRNNTIDTIKIQRVIKNCCEHMCQNLLTEWMNKFLEIHKIPIENHLKEEIWAINN